MTQCYGKLRLPLCVLSPLFCFSPPHLLACYFQPGFSLCIMFSCCCFLSAWQHSKYNFCPWQVEQLPITLSYLIMGSHQVCLEQCCLITFVLSRERHMWSAFNGGTDMCMFFNGQGIGKQAEEPSTGILHYESVKNVPSGFTWFSSTYLDSINDWWINLHCQMFSNINTHDKTSH